MLDGTSRAKLEDRGGGSDLIGERINNYEIVSLLGEGGMGAVYLAEHPFMGRKAAIKVLRRELAEDSGLVERFMNEARAANAIRHPNIIDIIDVGLLPSGIPYLMMEFLEGESLAKRIERQRADAVAEAVDVAAQTASALAAAHAKGIVHRDLKPDNLFLIPDARAPVRRAGQGARLRHRQAARRAVGQRRARRRRARSWGRRRTCRPSSAAASTRSITAPTSTRWGSSSTRC